MRGVRAKGGSVGVDGDHVDRFLGPIMISNTMHTI